MKRIVSLCVFLSIVIATLQAAFLENVPRILTQPDGSKLHCYATGDEYYHYLHDTNGYTIILNPETGYFVYADKIGEKLVPTRFIPGIDNPAKVGLQPKINISAAQWNAKREAFLASVPKSARKMNGDTNTNRGAINNIVIFIRFAGESNLNTSFSTVNNMFNDTTTPTANSMCNYFKAASYGKLNIKTHFYPTPNGNTILSYQDTYSRGYYQPYSVTNTIGYNGDAQRVAREHELLKNAVNFVSSSIPYSLNIDYDNDGYVDNVCFVVKGNVDDWSDLLWPHKWNLYSQYAYINNKLVNVYNFQLEGASSYFSNSVLSHEMFHTLGAPDLYHYYNSTNLQAVGRWDLMHENANPPQHSGAYMKYRYGNWIDSIPEITQSGTYTLNALGTLSNNNVCYKIASRDPNQYYVLEYRNKSQRFEGQLPGSGLLIYRINTLYHGNANYDGVSVFDEVYIYRPGGTHTTDGNLNTAHFSSSVNRSSFDDSTDPYPFLTDGSLSELNISNITANTNNSISFTYTFIPCVKPVNLAVSNIGLQSATLGWIASNSVTHYEIEYGISGFTIGSGIRTVVSSNNHTLTTLTPSTNYDFYVRSICNAIDTGSWSNKGSFTTLCSAQSLPYSEGFESGALPSCWTQEYVSGTLDWTYQTGGWNNTNPPTAHSGSYNATFTYTERGSATKLITPLLNLTTVTNPTLSFWHAQKEYGGDQDELRIYYRENLSSTWILLNSYLSNVDTWTSRTINLPNPSATYQIAFEATSNYGYGVVLDDISVAGVPITYDITVHSNDTIMGIVSGGGNYGVGSSITLTATPKPGYQFVSWNDGNMESSRTITVTQNVTYIATFASTNYEICIITATINDSVMGSTSGHGIYLSGDTITLEAIPAPYHHFVKWGDESIENPRIFVASQSTSYMAIFAPDTFTIAANPNNIEMGSISGCGNYPYNTQLTLTAIASPHHHFIKWDDGDTQNPRTITVTEHLSLTAFFAIDSFTVTAISERITMGNVSGTGIYAYGSSTLLTAAANEGYRFKKWDDDNTENPRTIVVVQDTVHIAYFERSTGIQDVNAPGHIELYPNPTTGTITISAETVQIVTVLDIFGRLMKTFENTKIVDITDLPEGVYTLHITMPKSTTIRKIIKTNSHK